MFTEWDKFWKKVDKGGTNGCWVWQAGKTEGYGKVHQTGGRAYYTHRLSLELKLGRPLGVGMVADHLCHNRACVNPEHLREATRRQNMENRKGATNSSKSGIRGVVQCPTTGKWLAYANTQGRKFNFGRYRDKEAATEAARCGRKVLYELGNNLAEA